MNNPEGLVKEVVYPVAGEDTLKSLLKEFKSSGPAYQQQVHKILRSSYSNHYRRMLPKILDALTFCSGNSRHHPVLDALDWLKDHENSTQRYIRLEEALLNKWILCCGTMKTVVSDNIKSMRYMLAYDGVLSGISVFYQNSADKTE
ncbi:hypothetical protein [Pantoea stewartii]|uniref:hypothetical protein n=1 Tax=Pantoea stewartii TaxID=66269 RepID=UPI0011329CFD|nr:hypothetical protein [Pantoea stewartii]